MPKMIQLRRVPDEVYTAVKTRAEAQQLSISDYLVQELTNMFAPQSSAEQPQGPPPNAGENQPG